MSKDHSGLNPGGLKVCRLVSGENRKSQLFAKTYLLLLGTEIHHNHGGSLLIYQWMILRKIFVTDIMSPGLVLVPPSCVPHVTESELGQFSVTNRHYRHTQKVV